MTYWYWKDSNSQWRWHLSAANNRIIANGGESYYNESDCLAAINLVKGSKDAPVKKK
ncbi:MAG: YegP family protein [Thermoanaerobaculia bacterium]